MSYYRKKLPPPEHQLAHIPIPEADIAERGGCYVEIEFSLHKQKDRSVIRIMRPNKPVTAFPGFVHILDGWYQWTVDGEEKKREEVILTFIKRYSPKVSIYLKAPWRVVAKVLSPT